MRALLAVAGLLVLAGTATAAGPVVHTLRKSPSGPIEAVAQDGNVAGWLTSSSQGGCDQVHVLAPGKRDRTLPQPASGTITCRWDLTDGQPQLAVAGHMYTALWTLHESGSTPFDFVLAAPFGGPERQIARLAHANDGTGFWLEGIAGAGKTLAYSWDEVEYVNKLGCLSGGSCKQKIADGGIDLVTRAGAQPQPLPGAQPALQLAASAGRIAYIPATTVKAGRPSPNTKSALYLVDARSGTVLGQPFVRGIPIAIALSPHVFAVLTTQTGPRARITWFSTTDGSKLGSVLVSRRAVPQLVASDQLIVYRVNRTLYSVSTHGGKPRLLAKTGSNPVGLSLSNGRLVWAENHAETGRLRQLSVGYPLTPRPARARRSRRSRRAGRPRAGRSVRLRARRPRRPRTRPQPVARRRRDGR